MHTREFPVLSRDDREFVDRLARLFLSQADVLDDVRVVDTGGEEREALRAGRADVVTGSFSDPRRVEGEGSTVDSLLVADRFPMCGPALVAREETLAERTDVLVRFLAGTMDGLAVARRNSAEAVAAIARRADGSELPDRDDEEHGASDAVRRWDWQRLDAWERLETVLRGRRLLEGAT